MMHEMRIGQRGRGGAMTRRAMVTWTKLACGAALTVALLGYWSGPIRRGTR
jgi:hypothetical protein